MGVVGVKGLTHNARSSLWVDGDDRVSYEAPILISMDVDDGNGKSCCTIGISVLSHLDVYLACLIIHLKYS